MTRWFERLPIHRKLVVMALVVTTAALTLATTGLIGVDLWSDRAAAAEDTAALASVLAENTSAAVVFKDPDAARQSLGTLRVRPAIRRACLFLPDGALFAGFARTASPPCASLGSEPGRWTIVTGTAAVISNDEIVGTVYVERELTEIWSKIAVAAVAGFTMLLLGGGVALAIANRLHRRVSAPISQLAAAARAIGSQVPLEPLPPIPAGRDEIADLVRAFSDMLRGVREANEVLARKEVEREQILARERDASRLKDEFLAAVSHELRTPLNAILGWIQVLRGTRPDEQTTARAIASIARNARAQTRVIEDLVDVSRIVTGKLDLRFEPIDLRDPVEGALDVIRPTGEARDIRFDVELPDRKCLVRGDRDRLQQIVWNLLSNAVKFTAAGESIRVVMCARGDAYEIEVTDTGVGIPPAFLPFAFDRFRQADGSMRREHGGLGLGLAIVKELTELHGGSVDARSPGPGYGATFTVRLPALTSRTRGAVPPGAGQERVG
jgi:signal transduction histidine kinase